MCQFCWTPLFLQLAISENWNWINLEIQQQINLYNIPILNIQKTWYHDTRCEICHFCFQSDLQMNPLWASKNWTASAEWYNYCSDVNYTRNCVWNIYDQNQASVEGRVSPSGIPNVSKLHQISVAPSDRCFSHHHHHHHHYHLLLRFDKGDNKATKSYLWGDEKGPTTSLCLCVCHCYYKTKVTHSQDDVRIENICYDRREKWSCYRCGKNKLRTNDWTDEQKNDRTNERTNKRTMNKQDQSNLCEF